MKTPHFNSKYHNILTKDFLYQEYIINKKSTHQIARKLNCSQGTVVNFLKKSNISGRTLKEAKKEINTKYTNILTKTFLYKEYIANKKSIATIAKEVNCMEVTINRSLKRNGIKTKSIRESHLKWNNILTKKFLIKEYIINNKPIIQIAKEIKACNSTVWEYLRICNISIKIRDFFPKGEAHWNWQGGIGKAPYPFEFNKQLKEAIRQRDNRTCQICGALENGIKLDVHHIDYNKNNSNPKNLISLCHSCHMQTNYNREIYIEYFGILKEIIYA